MPRYSNDPKETTVKLRLNDTMRNHIEKSAKAKSVSMSEYLRQLIRKDMRNNQHCLIRGVAGVRPPDFQHLPAALRFKKFQKVKKPFRQAVRHRNLTPAHIGSNPIRAVRFCLKFIWQNLLSMQPTSGMLIKEPPQGSVGLSICDCKHRKNGETYQRDRGTGVEHTVGWEHMYIKRTVPCDK